MSKMKNLDDLHSKRLTNFLLPKMLDKRLVTKDWVKKLYGDRLDDFRLIIIEREVVIQDIFSIADEPNPDLFCYAYHRRITDHMVEQAKLDWDASKKPSIKRVLIQDEYVGHSGGKVWNILFEYEREQTDNEVIKSIIEAIKRDIDIYRNEMSKIIEIKGR